MFENVITVATTEKLTFFENNIVFLPDSYSTFHLFPDNQNVNSRSKFML